MDWIDLETAHLRRESADIPTSELAAMIDRAQTVDQFNWLAWAFALQGATCEWMVTLQCALRVLRDPAKLNTFIGHHFSLYFSPSVHDDIRPHVETIRLYFITWLEHVRTSAPRAASTPCPL